MIFYRDEKTKEILISHKEISKNDLKKLEVEEDESKKEKHVPIVEKDGSIIHVKIGNIMHPMDLDHYISFVFLETNLGGSYRYLTYNQKPVVDFHLSQGEDVIAIYEYCTLHGLWKKSIKK